MTTTTPLYSDAYLFLLIHSKEKENFEIIYNRYSPVIYGFLINSGLSEKYSQDILQEAFSRIWNKSVPITINNNISFLTWILMKTTDSIKFYLQSRNRTYVIHHKDSFVISVEFTDILQSEFNDKNIA